MSFSILRRWALAAEHAVGLAGRVGGVDMRRHHLGRRRCVGPRSAAVLLNMGGGAYDDVAHRMNIKLSNKIGMLITHHKPKHT